MGFCQTSDGFRHINVWLDGPFEFLNYEETEQRVEEYMKELLKIQKSYRMKLRYLVHPVQG